MTESLDWAAVVAAELVRREDGEYELICRFPAEESGPNRDMRVTKQPVATVPMAILGQDRSEEAVVSAVETELRMRSGEVIRQDDLAAGVIAAWDISGPETDV